MTKRKKIAAEAKARMSRVQGPEGTGGDSRVWRDSAESERRALRRKRNGEGRDGGIARRGVPGAPRLPEKIPMKHNGWSGARATHDYLPGTSVGTDGSTSRMAVDKRKKAKSRRA